MSLEQATELSLLLWQSDVDKSSESMVASFNVLTGLFSSFDLTHWPMWPRYVCWPDP